MTGRTDAWPPGAPAWVSLTTDDVGAATGFYGDLLGWDFARGAAPDGRTYLTALVGGRPVAGVGQPTEPDVVAQWTVFLASPDADATARAAVEAGGAVVAGPTAVAGSGTAALLTDPAGAVVGIWQAGGHVGRQLADEPGAVAWCELVTPELEPAQRFYAAAFGVTFGEAGDLAGRYVTVRTAEGAAAGIGQPDAETGGAGEPHWLTYFAVTDVDTATEVAALHGGRLEQEPFDSAFGRVVVLRGPSGERFALLAAAG